MNFTTDNLPEAARATDADMAQWLAVAPIRAAANQHAALVLDRLYAERPGLREWLLNGTAPAFTDEPPEVTEEDWDAACIAYNAGGQSLRNALITDRARVWQTHRPKQTDPARFALEKVTEDQWRAFLESVDRHRYTDGHGGFGWPSIAISHLRTELACVLPVAEQPKQWAELTDEIFAEMYSKAVDASCLNTQEDWSVRRMAAGQVLRECFEAYAPPPRKVEVTPEVIEAFSSARDPGAACFSEEPGYEAFYAGHVSGVRAALAKANEQAEAREIEAVAELARLRALIGEDNITALSEGSARIIPANQAPGMPNAKCHACGIGDYCGNEDCPNAAAEIARLKGELKQALKDGAALADQLAEQEFSVKAAAHTKEMDDIQIERLTKGRDDWQAKAAQEHEQGNALVSDLRQEIDALRAHADKLEALLTVDGVDGPVKLWLPFEAITNEKNYPLQAAFRPAVYIHGSGAYALPSLYLSIRQSPAPAPEPLKRWKIANADAYAADVAYFVTVPMTRDEAEKRGKVIGEAGE